MQEQKPSVGRIVHYQSHGSPNGQHKSEPRAAIITAVPLLITDAMQGVDCQLCEDESVTPHTHDLKEGMRVDLCVLNPTGMHFDPETPFSEEPQPGHWNWPPRT